MSPQHCNKKENVSIFENNYVYIISNNEEGENSRELCNRTVQIAK